MRQTVARETRRFRFRETGGPLFGFGDDDLVVIAAGGPGPNARHGPMSFVPDRAAVGRAIDQVWREGEQRYRYLGSWHSHPRGRAIPSRRDRTTARGMSEDSALLLARPLILIQATRPTRRVALDRDLRGYRWATIDNDLVGIELRDLKISDRDWPVLTIA